MGTFFMFILAIQISVTPRIIIDSEKYRELMRPYEDCLRTSRMMKFYSLYRTCSETGLKSENECAEEVWAALDPASDSSGAESCIKFKPTKDQLLDDIARSQMTPNNSLQRTFESVTPFACAKAAPLSQAAELRR